MYLRILLPVQECVTTEEGKKKYVKTVQVKPVVQEEVPEFLRNAPTLIGVGVRGDVTSVEECYSMLAGRNVVPQFLELGTLCTVLGWGIGSTSMPAIFLLSPG